MGIFCSFTTENQVHDNNFVRGKIKESNILYH